MLSEFGFEIVHFPRFFQKFVQTVGLKDLRDDGRFDSAAVGFSFNGSCFWTSSFSLSCGTLGDLVELCLQLLVLRFQFCDARFRYGVLLLTLLQKSILLDDSQTLVDFFACSSFIGHEFGLQVFDLTLKKLACLLRLKF